MFGVTILLQCRVCCLSFCAKDNIESFLYGFFEGQMSCVHATVSSGLVESFSPLSHLHHAA